MNILWITNILFPEAERLLTGLGELKSSGGWMLGAAEALLDIENVRLIVATVSRKAKELTKLDGKKITYYVLPMGKGNLRINPEYERYWKVVKDCVKPDVVHIHGTEFSHGYAYLKTCGAENVVISIQGLTSAYYYYYYGISKREVYRNITFRDLIKGNMIDGQHDFQRRGLFEKEMIRMVNHVIGRTSWDRAHTWAINPHAKYHFCNEILRPAFYGGQKWNYRKCHKHTIFLSQAGYPVKGLHQVLKAMPLILRHYPDTVLRIAGHDITKTDTWIDKLKLSGYGLYIKRLIRRYSLPDRVIFTGNLNGEQMREEYLKANLFLCPSTIENSPNSLGEAQMLGTPCLASYVGGVPDMMKGNEENLYRFEEIEMLAEKVCRVFRDEDRQVDMRAEATKRHDPRINANKLIQVYKSIQKK